MPTVTLQKELKRIAHKHEKLAEELRRVIVLAERRERDLPYGNWKLKPSAVKRIERARKDIADGKGIKLKNTEELHAYFRTMRHAK